MSQRKYAYTLSATCGNTRVTLSTTSDFDPENMAAILQRLNELLCLVKP